MLDFLFLERSISYNAFAFNIVAPVRVVGAAAVKLMTPPCGHIFDSKINNRSKVFFFSILNASAVVHKRSPVVKASKTFYYNS